MKIVSFFVYSLVGALNKQLNHLFRQVQTPADELTGIIRANTNQG